MKKTLDKLWPALAESRLAVALFAGLFVAAVIFLSVPTQFTVRGTNALLRGSSGDDGAGSPAPGEETSGHALPPLGEEIAPATAMATSVAQVHPPLEPICDLSDRRYDGCEMWGDARTASGANNSVVYFIPPPPQLATAAAATWSIRSQSRKIVDVREVTVRSLDASSLHEAPRCTVRRGVPSVVFALGGLTSNYWHAFSDVLVPLFTTARAFGGDVELLATGAGAQAWFLGKYGRVFRALSRYDVVDLDADDDVVRCYAHLVVGLRGPPPRLRHRPSARPNGYDMLAFREFVRAAYPLPPPPPGASVALPCKSGGGGGTRPRLMLILRDARAAVRERGRDHGPRSSAPGRGGAHG
ncbi:unnamed protein product [Miscanthus lutarioriparius]|uniref:Uncharacterized protein n=1 Tax=Miscanthus lutarioriparius TaxID=422564 RepID=A0A811PRZ9_9POAL|nr:unnamed protein product [Miscanthus lutarioriparius]